jgi:BirA family biotin operon repressor/biotin-[acetyl-CoA-carboxylase] ligase
MFTTSELHLDAVESTMDAARSLASSQDFLLAWADAQTRGKGTRGRPWQSLPGNVYMTLGINRRHLPRARLALLPLEIGLHVREEAASRISPSLCGDLTLKWPNDLLFRGGKTAGILMEAHGEFMLIGIGVNVAGAPEVSDGGTPSACLAEAGMAPGDRDALVQGIYRRVREAERDEDAYDPESILVQWQGKVDWNRSHRLRDRPGTPLVLPLSVNRHGHLQVQHADGSREWLVSDYLS